MGIGVPLLFFLLLASQLDAEQSMLRLEDLPDTLVVPEGRGLALSLADSLAEFLVTGETVWHPVGAYECRLAAGDQWRRLVLADDHPVGGLLGRCRGRRCGIERPRAAPGVDDDRGAQLRPVGQRDDTALG